MNVVSTASLLGLLMTLTLPAQAGIDVTDGLGRAVTLEKPAERIIALAPHIVENVYSAGAGDKLVATVSHSDYPPEASELPQLGSYRAVSLEQILGLEPDLVLLWASGNGEETLRQLERLGVTVYASEPRMLEDVAQSVIDIGTLAGTREVAETAAREYLDNLDQLREQYAGRDPVRVFYQVWNKPLQTLNDEHLVSAVIRLCGGRNVYADAAPLAPKINMESVLDRNPQAIVASGMGDERPDWLDEWHDWPGLTAVQENNLFFVPPDILQRHTVRIAQGSRLFCEHIETARQRLE